MSPWMTHKLMSRIFFILVSLTCLYGSALPAKVVAAETPAVRISDILKTDVLDDEKTEEKSKPIASQTELRKYIDIPEDDYNRGQPRSMVKGFLSAARANDFKLASEFLDYRNIRESTLEVGKEELASQLYVVLNRTLWIDLENISQHPLGNLNENLPSYRESVGQISTKLGHVKILLQRIPRAQDKVKIWKISNATVDKIPELSKQYAYTPFGEWLSKHLPTASFLNVMLWQWVYYLHILLLYFVIAKILTWITSRLAKKIWPKISIETQKFIEQPVAILLMVMLTRTFFAEENLTLAAKAVGEGATLLTLAWIWVAFRFIDLLKLRLANYFVTQDKPLAVYLLRPAGTVLKSLVALSAVLIWFENLGFSATTLLAGLGIGGLAVALAAQKTVENIIGAITLYTSAPVKIGDFCRFGSQYGIVEEIGLRATRIRTLDRTVLYIANALFVDMQIENYSERERIAFRPKLKLQVASKKENVQLLLNDIKSLLSEHEKVSDSPLRAHFKQFSTLGLELDVLSYVETVNFEEYLNVINELNLAILALLERHECSLMTVDPRVAEMQAT